MRRDPGKVHRWQRMRSFASFIYDHSPAGCCLHIVLDDGNTDDQSVRICQHAAIAAGHANCLQVAAFLWGLSPDQRRAFLRVRR